MNKKNLQIQLVIVGLIFLLFFLGVFFIESYLLPYLLIPLIVANVVFLFVNKTKGLVVNVLLLGCSFLMFVFLIEYIASILGLFLSLYHGLRIGYVYYQQHGEPVETVKVKTKNKK